MKRGLAILLSFPVVITLIAALTLALIFLGRFYWGLGLATLFLLVVPIVLAAIYLAWYSTLPYTPPRPRLMAPPVVPGEEAFEDPVEEADRYDEFRETGELPEEEDDEPVDAGDPPARDR
jgi:membrane-associated phospholipid phosphatase